MRGHRKTIRIKCPKCNFTRTITYDARDEYIPVQPRVCNNCGEDMVDPATIPKVGWKWFIKKTIRKLQAPAGHVLQRKPYAKPVPVERPSMVLGESSIDARLVERYERKRANCNEIFAVHDELLKNDPNKLSSEFLITLIKAKT